MIFSFTIDKVLSKQKTQTSRIWTDNYEFRNGAIYSWHENKYGVPRKLYYIGQELSVQPARGNKGIARIRVTNLAKCDVRNFGTEDIAREGFENIEDFHKLWASMHDESYLRNVNNKVYSFLEFRPKEFYTALVIRFELI